VFFLGGNPSIRLSKRMANNQTETHRKWNHLGNPNGPRQYIFWPDTSLGEHPRYADISIHMPIEWLLESPQKYVYIYIHIHIRMVSRMYPVCGWFVTTSPKKSTKTQATGHFCPEGHRVGAPRVIHRENLEIHHEKWMVYPLVNIQTTMENHHF
jgi:hypothetical protein